MNIVIPYKPKPNGWLTRELNYRLVLIRLPNLVSLQWAMGRVQEVHPGPDDIARTATVKTAKGSYVRPLSKLSILPM